ncbi:MAG: hypothetical protein AAFZ65_09475 [Planctomycetota bacterium]
MKTQTLGTVGLLLLVACTAGQDPQAESASPTLGRTVDASAVHPDVTFDKANRSPARTAETYYFDNGERRPLFVDRLRVAEVAPSAESEAALRARFLGASSEPSGSPAVRIWRIADEPGDLLDALRELDASLGGGQFSPVLTLDEAGTSGQRVLVGDVLVALDPSWSAIEVQDWAERGGHAVRTASSLGPNTLLLESAAGLASLELANRLVESEGALSAEPNFWKQARPR